MKSYTFSSGIEHFIPSSLVHSRFVLTHYPPLTPIHWVIHFFFYSYTPPEDQRIIFHSLLSNLYIYLTSVLLKMIFYYVYQGTCEASNELIPLKIFVSSTNTQNITFSSEGFYSFQIEKPLAPTHPPLLIAWLTRRTEKRICWISKGWNFGLLKTRCYWWVSWQLK